jgi:hypothetical protein
MKKMIRKKKISQGCSEYEKKLLPLACLVVLYQRKEINKMKRNLPLNEDVIDDENHKMPRKELMESL